MKIGALSLALLCLASFLAAASSRLSEEEAARRAAKLADELQSPFCPGKTLNTCTSSQAFDVRQQIAGWFQDGWTREEVMTKLTEDYGGEIANPPQPWFTALIPYSPLVLGAIAVWLFVRRNLIKRGSGPSAPSLSGGANDERLARLRRQITSDDV